MVAAPYRYEGDESRQLIKGVQQIIRDERRLKALAFNVLDLRSKTQILRICTDAIGIGREGLGLCENKSNSYLGVIPTTDHQLSLGILPSRYTGSEKGSGNSSPQPEYNRGAVVVTKFATQIKSEQHTKRRDPSQWNSHLVPARCASGKAVFLGFAA